MSNWFNVSGTASSRKCGSLWLVFEDGKGQLWPRNGPIDAEKKWNKWVCEPNDGSIKLSVWLGNDQADPKLKARLATEKVEPFTSKQLIDLGLELKDHEVIGHQLITGKACPAKQ